MESLVLAARAGLALVFGVAAVAKLRDRAHFRAAVGAFGVPPAMVGVIAVTLPLVEIGIAAVLLTAFAWLAAIGAGVLLALFTCGIALNLMRGRTPACRCFGQLQSAPIGAGTLLRNAAFAVAAGLIVWAPPGRDQPGFIEALSALTGVRPILLVLGLGAGGIVAAQALLQWNLLLQHGRLLRRLDHLEQHTGVAGAPAMQPNGAGLRPLVVGAAAPPFELSTAAGTMRSLAQLRSTGEPVMLVFTEPGCPACKDFLPVMRGWERRYASRLRIAVITTAGGDGSHLDGVRTALFQRNREISDAYGISAIPAAVLVRADGTIGSSVMLGGEAIATLLPTVAAKDEGGSAIPIIEALA
jgi:thiol-disulfide isomerase/thioredoxin